MSSKSCDGSSVKRLMTYILLTVSCIIAFPVVAACQPATTQAPPQTTPAPAVQSQPPAPSQPPATTPVLSTWKADGVITPGEYQKNRTYNNYEVHWSSDSQYACFAIKAKTTGWVAIGFDPESFMKNADIVEGFVSDGKVTVLDMFSTGDFGPHPQDIQQGGTNDILESGGAEENGFTVIEFKRKIDTGDKFDKVLGKGTHKIIWAFGSDDQATVKHSGRGIGEIDF